MPYHLRRNDREITDHSVLSAIVSRGRYASLALCRDNEPYIVTLSYGYQPATGTLYFHGAQEGLKNDFLKYNNRVCLTIIEATVGADCDHAYRSVVIRGNIVHIEDENEKLQAVSGLLSHFKDSCEKMQQKIDTASPTWQQTQMMKIKIIEITGKEKQLP